MGNKSGKFAIPKTKGKAKDEVQDPAPAGDEVVEKAEAPETETSPTAVEDTTKPECEVAANESEAKPEECPASNENGATDKEDDIQELPEQTPAEETPTTEKGKKKKNPIKWLKKNISFRKKKEKDTPKDAENGPAEEEAPEAEKPAVNGHHVEENGEATEEKEDTKEKEATKESPVASPSNEEPKTDTVNGDSLKPENGED